MDENKFTHDNKLNTGGYEYPNQPQLYFETKIDSIQPYVCPVCLGRGQVQSGFYTSTSGSWISGGGTEECRSCKGTGVLWK